MLTEFAEADDPTVLNVSLHFKDVMAKAMTITDLSFCLLSDVEFLKARKGVNQKAIQMLEDYFVALYDEKQSMMPIQEYVMEMIKYFEH